GFVEGRIIEREDDPVSRSRSLLFVHQEFVSVVVALGPRGFQPRVGCSLADRVGGWEPARAAPGDSGFGAACGPIVTHCSLVETRSPNYKQEQRGSPGVQLQGLPAAAPGAAGLPTPIRFFASCASSSCFWIAARCASSFALVRSARSRSILSFCSL